MNNGSKTGAEPFNIFHGYEPNRGGLTLVFRFVILAYGGV